MMKCFVFILVLIFTLTGCDGLSPVISKTLSIDGKVYKTGFYETLFPNDYEFSGETLENDQVTLN